jgi:sigma-B regulation protein RsbU (phosphoserine phosphatase)
MSPEVRTFSTRLSSRGALSIANSGDPITPAAMKQLFQPFYRGTVKQSLQGLGLGLYIAFEIARAHGGTLDVRSSQDETRFTFRMPTTVAPL